MSSSITDHDTTVTTATVAATATAAATEQDVLASLQASLHDQDAYEDGVLRQASHQLAPTLDPATRPFPLDLAAQLGVGSIDHPQSNGTNEPTSATVLSGTDRLALFHVLAATRRTLAENPDDAVALIKEQMLLVILLQGATATSGGGDSNGSSHHRLEDVPLRLRDERVAEQARSLRLRQPAPTPDDCPEANGMKASASKQPAKRRTRVPLMKRKRMESNAAVNDDNDDNGGIDKEELLRLRKERRARMLERRKQLQMDESSSSSDEENEMEMEVSDENTETHEKETFTEESKLQASPVPVVVCPLCNASVSVPEEGNVDEVLSRHMQACQQAPPTRTRQSRRSRGMAPTTAPTTTFPDEGMARQHTTNTTRRVKKPRAKQQRGRRKAVIPVRTEPDMDDMDVHSYEDRVDDWLMNGLRRMKTMRERDENEIVPGAEEYKGGLLVPEWINNRLFGYQREGLQWMWEVHQQLAGGIIGDEMGLGKTVQVAAFLGAAASSRKLKSVLVISPATMLQHWLSELAVWAPGLRRVLIHTSGGDSNGHARAISNQLLGKLARWLRDARSNRINEAIDEQDWESHEHHEFCGTGYVVVTTYENLRRNVDVYANHDFSYVVLDEAQKIRNPDADVTLACKRIRTPHRFAMSGTPIQNDLRELWSLFDFVYPGRLGTLPAFEQEFAVPIKRGGYSNASPMQVQLAYRCALMLRDLINPFLLRRLKKDVKEVSRMPSKTEHVLFCRLSDKQRAMYESYLRSEDVQRVLRGNTQLLGAITMLRKIANHPDLVIEPTENSFDSFVKHHGINQSTLVDDSDSENEIMNEDTLMERSGKLEVLSKILPLWHKQGHRVLIFCQWRKMLDIIKRFTMLKGWKFSRLDGNTNIAARQRLVDTFNRDTSYFGMLCTTKTGGVGLNLTGANRIILYDPDWNPSGDAQARERAWRFGQEREVTIYRLITAGTIEEKMYQRQIFKTALTNKVLQDPKQRRLFSQRDLRDLFSLGADTGSVRSGGDGVTETSKVTRGVGIVETGDAPNDDDNATLKKVMKSEGLAGIFDHHSVEFDHKRKSTTVREMEEMAKDVAKKAADALANSVMSSDPYAPDERTNPGKFGSSRAVGGARPASKATGPMASSSLLASLRERNAAIATVGESSEPDDTTKKHAVLLGRLKQFVQKRAPTTEEILKHFDSVPDSDVAIFRRLLKSVAIFDNGRWHVVDN